VGLQLLQRILQRGISAIALSRCYRHR